MSFYSTVKFLNYFYNYVIMFLDPRITKYLSEDIFKTVLDLLYCHTIQVI